MRSRLESDTPDRRRFLRQLLTGSAGLALGAELDLDRLLWIPKAMVTVPRMPRRGWYAPTQADIDKIIHDAAERIAQHIDQQAYEMAYQAY